MSKRFELLEFDDGTEGVYDNLKERYLFGYDEVVELLNIQRDRIAILEDSVLAMNMTNGNLEGALKCMAKEIEGLKKELDNFKPVMFQDRRKGTVILYSKGDV